MNYFLLFAPNNPVWKNLHSYKIVVSFLFKSHYFIHWRQLYRLTKQVITLLFYHVFLCCFSLLLTSVKIAINLNQPNTAKNVSQCFFSDSNVTNFSIKSILFWLWVQYEIVVMEILIRNDTAALKLSDTMWSYLIRFLLELQWYSLICLHSLYQWYDIQVAIYNGNKIISYHSVMRWKI